MFNVVVDTENTGKQLLQNGELRRRVTIIPLNKIQSHPVPLRVQNTAVRLVCLCFCLHTSISLVSYYCLYLSEAQCSTFSGWQRECRSGSVSCRIC